MKKFLALILALVMALSLVACGGNNNETPDDGNTDGEVAKVKVGFITLHDENSTYDLNFINGAKEALANLGLTEDDYILKTNVPEGQECYDTAVDLVDAGCNIIFADSFGHEPYMIQAAQEFPEVQFCHSTGTRAHTEGLANYHNAFASIYEGRYLAGIAAGMQLNEMIEAGWVDGGGLNLLDKEYEKVKDRDFSDTYIYPYIYTDGRVRFFNDYQILTIGMTLDGKPVIDTFKEYGNEEARILRMRELGCQRHCEEFLETVKKNYARALLPPVPKGILKLPSAFRQGDRP